MVLGEVEQVTETMNTKCIVSVVLIGCTIVKRIGIIR